MAEKIQQRIGEIKSADNIEQMIKFSIGRCHCLKADRKDEFAVDLIHHIGVSFLHGASFIDRKHIVLGLTVRGKDADKFWFSLFHEIHHITEGHISMIDRTTNKEEKEADMFACNTLIPYEDYIRFLNQNDYSKEAIVAFAESINIASGIVVGRLQKDNVIPFNRYNELKVKYMIKD